MAAEPAEAALAAAVSPPTKEIIAVHRAEYSNIRQMAMDGLLEDDRKNARLDAADNRYDVAMEERRKGRERKRVQAEAMAAKEASSDDADYGSPKPSAKKRKIERKSAKSASKSGSKSGSKSQSASARCRSRKGWNRDPTDASQSKERSLQDSVDELLKTIASSTMTINYHDQDGKFDSIQVPSTYKDKDGETIEVWKKRPDPSKQQPCTASASDGSEDAAPAEDRESCKLESLEFQCSLCDGAFSGVSQLFGAVFGLTLLVLQKCDELSKIKGYLRNHHKWCERHHDAVVNTLPDDLIPAGAKYIRWAENPKNAARKNKYRRGRESGGISAEEAMLEDSGLMDDEGR